MPHLFLHDPSWAELRQKAQELQEKLADDETLGWPATLKQLGRDFQALGGYVRRKAERESG